jgi:hypothetical protein
LKKFVLIILFAFTITNFAQDKSSEIIAGVRASRILSNYPNNQFPSPLYWYNASEFVSNKFNGAKSSVIWIVSLYLSDGYTQLNFPNPGGSYPYVYFIGSDQNEAYLTLFDQKGINVWLQVEPGAAKIDTLIHIVLNKYKHHPCVKGFGIDVEWYNTHIYSGGQKVTDAEAKRWESKVKSIDSSYTLFLKHYGLSWMPPNYRGDILFIDDSQDFTSLNALVSEFKLWGNKFKPNKVAFQFGYPIDKPWWSKLNDPVKTIGDALLTNISNCYGLFWVDFTINYIYPVTSVGQDGVIADEFFLSQNYPNPFNPSTKFYVITPSEGNLSVEIFTVNGEKLEEYCDNISAGRHEFNWNAANRSSGVYLLKVSFTNSENKLFVRHNKMLLIK